MIKRKIEEKIKNHIQTETKALLVTGARQIGKTYLIRSILEESGVPFLELNFVEQPALVSIFEQAKNTDDLLFRLSATADVAMLTDGSVIFLDEIQECKDFLTRIKFLVEDGRYRYILSGSLLGVELSDLRSAPVGYLSVLDMYPLTLTEFFTALGLNDAVFSHIRECYAKRCPVDDAIHKRLMDAFYLYLIVGGMPEAVQAYLDTNRIGDVADVQEQIIRLYYADFSKYEKREKLQLKEIYDAVPSELQEKNKRFFINHIAGRAEYDDVKNAFLWLKNAGVAIPVYNVTEPKSPLKISEKRNLFKLFLSDVGLLTSLYGTNVRLQILNRDKGINNGGLFENAVAQELLTRNFPLYYYNSKKSGELDFVIPHNGAVLPIEVKSGKDYKRHSALSSVLREANFDIPEAFVLCNENVRQNGSVVYLPIYMALCIEDAPLPDEPYVVDLSTL